MKRTDILGLLLLAACSQNIDKDNEDIASYAPDVLKQLTVAMKEFAATNEGRLHSTELRLLMRVL